jgi:hypothetical protein
MDPRAYSTDYSFQVAISLQNFFTVKSGQVQGGVGQRLYLVAQADRARVTNALKRLPSILPIIGRISSRGRACSA